MAARQRWAWTALVPLVLGLALVGGQANAEPGGSSGDVTAAPAGAVGGDLPDVSPTTVGSHPSEAELDDLRTIAQQEGIPLERAVAQYAWNDNFAAALDEIRAVSGDLAEAVITQGGSAWIAFAEDESAEAAAVMARFAAAYPTVDVDVRTGAGFTEAELENALARVHRAVHAERGVAHAVTSYDRPSRQIVTTVSLLPDASSGLMSKLQTLSASSLVDDRGRSIGDVISTNVVRRDAALTSDESSSYHYGGENITGCTSGFAVRRLSDNSRGIAFAEHCDGTIYDDGDILTYRGAHNGTHGDMEWRYGPDYEADDFYSGSSTATEVNRLFTFQGVAGV